MANPEQFANSARGTLSAGINDSVTTLSLDSGQGALFPATGNFRIRIDDEIMIVGARSGDALSSITRGAEGTTAASHSTGAAVTLPLTAGSLPLAHRQSKTGGTFLGVGSNSKMVRLEMPCDGKFIGWTVLNGVAMSVVFDVRKKAYSAYVASPVGADSIAAADKPTTSSSLKAQGSCTGWGTFAAGDIVYIACESGPGSGDSSVFLSFVPIS